MCRHKSLVSSGIHSVLKPLIDDIISPQTEGVDLGRFGILKGKVVLVLGDNLGSHMIGGFLENFTGNYFCRYCLATKECLETGLCLPGEFTQRTPVNYDAAVNYIQCHNVDNFEGIKQQSPLHTIPGFHVCAPSLPPCLGHDLFEGVVPADLTLCLRYFVLEKKWLTFAYINRQIELLKLKGAEAKDRPPFINASSGKVSGHAVQIWVFLRFMPLCVGDKTADTSDCVWQLILVMREVVELVCAPRSSPEQVSHMNDKIEAYIELRMKCFPDNKLKPKHHYITHYPALTMQCGPLIHIWTFILRVNMHFSKKLFMPV